MLLVASLVMVLSYTKMVDANQPHILCVISKGHVVLSWVELYSSYVVANVTKIIPVSPLLPHIQPQRAVTPTPVVGIVPHTACHFLLTVPLTLMPLDAAWKGKVMGTQKGGEPLPKKHASLLPAEKQLSAV